MRASKIADIIEAAVDRTGQRGYPIPGEVILFRDFARCLAATQAAVEALAADAGTGPAQRIKAILDGEEGT